MRLKNQVFFLWFNRIVFPLFYWRHQGKISVVIDADKTTRFLVRVNTSDILVIWEIWRAKVYDDRRFLIEADHTVVDIGAHIGGFSVRAAHLAHDGRVFAYEASSRNFSMLAENRRLNNATNLHIENKAISDRRGEVRFFMPGNNGALGSLLQDMDSPNELIQSATLHDVFSEHNLEQVDYLKLDVEGAEYGILSACSRETLAKVKRIVMEFHEFENDSRNHRDLVTLLQSHGFRVVVERGIFAQTLLFGTGIIKAWRE